MSFGTEQNLELLKSRIRSTNVHAKIIDACVFALNTDDL